MAQFPELGEVIQYVCNRAGVLNNKNTEWQIIEGLGEVEVNGTVYQVQLILEPRNNYWAKENETVIRKTEE